jgi:hypothetical protein
LSSPQQLIFSRRNTLIALRRAIGPMRDVFNALLNRHLPMIRDRHLVYFRDLYDPTVRIYELLEIARERLSNALEVHLSHISNTLNQVMKRLLPLPVWRSSPWRCGYGCGAPVGFEPVQPAQKKPPHSGVISAMV